MAQVEVGVVRERGEQKEREFIVESQTQNLEDQPSEVEDRAEVAQVEVAQVEVRVVRATLEQKEREFIGESQTQKRATGARRNSS
jgi:hypothetical protein